MLILGASTKPSFYFELYFKMYYCGETGITMQNYVFWDNLLAKTAIFNNNKNC